MYNVHPLKSSEFIFLQAFIIALTSPCAVGLWSFKTVLEATLKTTFEPEKIMIFEDIISNQSCNGNLRFFEVFIADKEDNSVTTAQLEISCQVDNCRLLGIYSANPCNEDVYGSNECHTFDGRALAVVEVFDDNPKKIRILANGLISGELEFN